MAVELFDLEVLRVVARVGSITQAAITLHMAQPSLSHRIMSLEEEMGQALFIRHRRGVVPTEAGRKLVEYANRAVALIAEGVDVVKTMSEPHVRIKIAGPPSINSHVLPALLQNLLDKRHEVVLHDGHSHEVIQLVQDGSVHAGFVLGGVMPPGLCALEILRDDIVCVGRWAEDMTASPQTMANLATPNLILFPFSREYATFKQKITEKLGQSLDRVPEISPAATVRDLILSGNQYYSFLPRSVVKQDVLEGRMSIQRLSDLPQFFWRVHVVYKKGSVSERVMAALWNSIEEIWGVKV